MLFNYFGRHSTISDIFDHMRGAGGICLPRVFASPACPEVLRRCGAKVTGGQEDSVLPIRRAKALGRRIMKKLTVGLFTVSLVVGPSAFAGDMAAKAPPPPSAPPTATWTGFYFGGNVGGGWANTDVSFVPNDPNAAFVLSPGQPSTSFSGSGVLGGLELGYNWQLSRQLLVGLETDFDWSNIKASGASNNPAGFGSPIAPVSERLNWLGTVRARLGYLPIDNLLTYVTGGFAYGQIEQSGTYGYANTGSSRQSAGSGTSVSCGANAGAPTCFSGTGTDTATGWTLGGGFEYAFWQRWSVKAEYLYVSLGGNHSLNESALVLSGPGTAPSSITANFNRMNLNVARLGVNYRF
jgi:outer membrane immunogenic protein